MALGGSNRITPQNQTARSPMEEMLFYLSQGAGGQIAIMQNPSLANAYRIYQGTIGGGGATRYRGTGYGQGEVMPPAWRTTPGSVNSQQDMVQSQGPGSASNYYSDNTTTGPFDNVGAMQQIRRETDGSLMQRTYDSMGRSLEPQGPWIPAPKTTAAGPANQPPPGAFGSQASIRKKIFGR
jgi:hypothetical protein